MKITYKLEVWSKLDKKYHTSYEGKNLERARIQSRKPYNNYDWQEKKKIVKITEEIVK